MKKILLAGGVILLVVIAAGYWLLSDLDQIVHDAIERAGTEALGVEVSVASVEIDLKAGQGSIKGLEVANPEGFGRSPLFSADEVTLRLAKGGVIELARLVGPSILVEGTLSENNVSALLAGMPESSPPATESEVVDEAGEPVVLQINRVEIVEVSAVVNHVDADEPAQFEIGEIVLTKLEGTTEEIAHQAAGQLMQQISSAAQTALKEAVGAAVEEAVGEVKKGLRQKLEEALEGAGDDGEDDR